MMEDETVARRNWLSREQFLDLLGMANLLPGPSSSEMAIYLGFLRAGWLGLLLGGVCFVLPAALLTTLLACAYLRFGSLPQTAGVFYGVRPVVVAIVLQALWRLGRTALKSRTLVWRFCGRTSWSDFTGSPKSNSWTLLRSAR
jgi:chromate transporter